jgi:hypothetical protein
MVTSPETIVHDNRNPMVAVVASILPGLGEVYTEQTRKGVALVIISLLLLYVIIAYRNIASELADTLYVALLLYGAYDSYSAAKLINEGLA